MQRYIVIIVGVWLWASAFSANAQDTLNPKRKLNFVFKLDNRFSFVGDQLLAIYGFRTGIKLHQQHELGIAFNWIASRNTTEVELPVFFEVAPADSPAREGTFFYRYAGVFYEYNFSLSPRWQVNIPIQLGGGRAGLNIYQMPQGTWVERRQARFALLEPAYMVSYRFMRYAGIGSGWGYRFAFSPQKIVKENLTRPVFIVKLRLYLGEIYRGLRGKSDS
ncbi:MAG: hypothetical protein MUE85_05125 [Microscillaceae bacterium]|jgi:hypothetical protein|nr:hypothetical protein [Microscillaceae bacterium]